MGSLGCLQGDGAIGAPSGSNADLLLVGEIRNVVNDRGIVWPKDPVTLLVMGTLG